MSIDRRQKNPLIFAVPGSKTYIGDYYSNTRGSFINISITGGSCLLQCRHCRGELLRGMIHAGDSLRLVSVAERYLAAADLQGILISGGFDREGKLGFSRVLEGIGTIKSRHPHLTVYIHTGFLDEKEAGALGQTGVDGVLVNLVKSRKAIQEVYNLKGRTYSDYLDTISYLKKEGIRVSPHIIIGLENGRLSHEYSMVEDAIGLEVDSIVFAVLKKASRSIQFPSSSVPGDDIIRLVRHARSLGRGTFLSYGCARPPGRSAHMLETGLIKEGIDSIAFPSDSTVRFAVENKIAHTFVEKCCANL